MKKILSSIAIAALALGPVHAASASTLDRAGLKAASAPALVDMRGGAPAARASTTSTERAQLKAAQQRSTRLGALRAGEFSLSDHDIGIIAVVVLVVVLIIIIA